MQTNAKVEHAETARTGRERQVFDANGARTIAGIVPFYGLNQVVLISSASHPKRWIFPKGGVENDETVEESALREGWEEAGVKGTLVKALGLLPHHKTFPAGGPVAIFHFYRMDVQELCEVYPESSERRRIVVSVEEAKTKLSKPYMVEFLERALGQD